MLPPAARLIAERSSFKTGSCWHNIMDLPCGPGDACSYDAMGAIFTAYARHDIENRHLAAKRAFALCKARYGHSRLGQLHWEQALEILTDSET